VAGNRDDGERLEACARRELEEEFLRPAGLVLPADAVLRYMCSKQTRPVRSTSNMMHVFVCLEAENTWLSRLDLAAINAGLARRAQRFQSVSGVGGAFWSMPREKREAHS
jgi:ADP-ribose pyrophosphatase YjhB (NUDIX family)